MVKRDKKPKTQHDVSGKKIVREKENAEEYKSKNPVWRFHRYDQDHPKWCLSQKDFYGYIISKLISFERMTWHDIEAASGGRKQGTNHHFIPVSDMTKEAQQRLQDIKVFYDELFSLRLSNIERLYGILENGIFHIIWYDPQHEICPAHKKNT